MGVRWLSASYAVVVAVVVVVVVLCSELESCQREITEPDKMPLEGLSVVRCDENEYRLIRDLLVGYDKRVRPSRNYTESLNVTFGLALAQIIDVDMKNQILTTNCWLNQIWTDVGLQWDPDKYGGIRVVRLPFEEVWRPDILLYNNADVSSHFSSISSNVIVTNDGNVTWLCMIIFKSSCLINVRYFPFDWQNCSLWFASWTYDGFNINLIINSEEGDTSNYIANSEWELLAMLVEKNVRYYSCCKEPYPDITFYILIRRRPLFYIFNMILPCILITLVALLGFYIPSDSGEKVTMGITTLLSMTVFMMLVTENMPPTSDVLPLIGIYYGMTIFIVSFATGMTVFTLNIHHKGVRGKEVPAFVKLICFRILARLFCIRVESSHIFTPECNGAAGSSSYIRYKMAPQHEPDISPVVEYKAGSEHVNLGRVDIRVDKEQHQQQPLSPTHTHPHSSPTHSHSGGGGSPRGGGGGTGSVTSSNFLYPLQRMRTSLNTNNTPSAYPPPSPTLGGGAVGGMAAGTGAGAGNGADSFETQFSRVLHKVYQTIERNEMRVLEQDKRDVIKVEWQQVAQITDRVLLLLFVTATFTITGVVLFQSPNLEVP
ncbi:neuronal acetylcholine receptor subunit alpha-10-like [Littorina saxatilis]|uniref:neuronal acetylcholine receptor subunit alpha-10-like n=1 Tax=Littorina saxatilis TaxID=31220 RepID=UPI0038B60C58